MLQKNLIFIAVVFISSCVAQPFTPYVPPGKKKTQTFPLILPPRQTTTGCDVTLRVTSGFRTDANSPFLIGVSGTRNTLTFELTEGGANVNTTRSVTSSNPAIARISSVTATAITVSAVAVGGPVDISLDCSPSTKISVTVNATQNNIQDEKSLSENEKQDKDVTKNE